MTSANFDGQWTARLLEHFGNRTVAGSSSRRGMRAMLELKRAVEQGHPAAFALDGPAAPRAWRSRGPRGCRRRRAIPSCCFTPRRTGHWTLSSWDRTQVPKPFSRVAIVLGEPVPPGQADDHGIVERRLIDLQQRAARRVSGNL
jgi:lysophospholipid acyltransferase (LPLAT)-like uncharacterized protein